MRIAVVDESLADRDLLRAYLERYKEERDTSVDAEFHEDAALFLKGYQMRYDVLFLDAGDEGFDCMELCRKIRKLDENALIILIADSARHAMEGYRVSAFSYLLKPVSYETFREEMDRALRKLRRRDHSFVILPSQSGELVKADMNDMRYFESDHNKVILHCKYGRSAFYGSLKKMEEILDPALFVRCNNCYLVNLRFVTAVEGAYAVVDGKRLAISKAKRKGFLDALSRYISNTG